MNTARPFRGCSSGSFFGLVVGDCLLSVEARSRYRSVVSQPQRSRSRPSRTSSCSGAAVSLGASASASAPAHTPSDGEHAPSPE